MTGKTHWLTIVGCGVPILLLAAVVLFPVFAKSRSGGGPGCMSRLRECNLACLSYASDHDDRLPPAPAWVDCAQDYARNSLVFVCPDVRMEHPGGYGYAMNFELSAKALKDVPKPSESPLLFDSVLLARNATSGFYGFPDPPRHRGNNVAYLDGHVERMIK